MMSYNGFMFGVINTVGNFGTVFVDQSYWQSAIAAKPASAHKGYMLGGMVWFAIPFSLASSLGVEPPPASDFELLEGEGVRAIVDGVHGHVGSDSLARRVLAEAAAAKHDPRAAYE